METIPSIHRVDFQDFLDKLNNNMNGEKVSDDSFLKYAVYEENSDYKKSIVITSITDAQNQNIEGIRKLEIYRDRFGLGNKMVFSQKVQRKILRHNENQYRIKFNKKLSKCIVQGINQT